jgi:hypothetical protein
MTAAARKLPDDLQVLSTYLYECTNPKKRGALARTAKRYGCSDQYVSNIVKHHRQAAPVDSESTNLYDPSNGAYEAHKAAQMAAWRAERLQAKNAALLCRLLTPIEPDIANDADSALESAVGISPSALANHERQHYTFNYEMQAQKQHNANDGYAVLWGCIALAMTLCFLMASMVALWPAVLLFVASLGSWWLVGDWRRLTSFEDWS